VATNSRAIENDRSSSNKAFVADPAGVNNRTVRHRDTITNHSRILGRTMNHNIVL
jgi:hypothetical protein